MSSSTYSNSIDDELLKLANIVKRFYSERELLNHKIHSSRSIGGFRIPEKFSTIHGHEKLELVLKKATQYRFVNKQFQQKQKDLEDLKRLESIMKQEIEYLKTNKDTDNVEKKEQELSIISRKVFNLEHEEKDYDETRSYNSNAFKILKILCERNEEGYSSKKASNLYRAIINVMCPETEKNENSERFKRPERFERSEKFKRPYPSDHRDKFNSKNGGFNSSKLSSKAPHSYIPPHLQNIQQEQEQKEEFNIIEESFPTLGSAKINSCSGAWARGLSKEVITAPPPVELIKKQQKNINNEQDLQLHSSDEFNEHEYDSSEDEEEYDEEYDEEYYNNL